MQLPPLSLYVHLPWCERKCPYCDFNSHERAEPPEDAYIEALLKDLQVEVSGVNRVLQTVFIGGGTPSLFSVGAIERLLHGIRDIAELRADAEVTMEANPSSVESERLAGYVGAGVTRFSLGVQSFDNECLQALGRLHDSASAQSAIQAARESGAMSFNVDIMHGLPSQTVVQGLRDVQKAIESGAPHISWYQLTIEPNTRFYSDPPTLPIENILSSLEEQGVQSLLDAGYERYEVSAWAKAGERCEHNLNYWRFGDYLAIGAGAHGKLSRSDGSLLRYAKTRQPDDYLGVDGTTRRAERMLDAADRRGEFMLNVLRLTEGFSMADFVARTGLAVEAIRDDLTTLENQGLLEEIDGRFRTTVLGGQFLDDVVARFFE